MHRHAIGAESEIYAVSQAENARIAPDEVKPHGQNGEGEKFTQQPEPEFG
ncbi:Uncharacterised protein [Mycobacterium tuberculosis]|nr:Uncharacterised protein [Mycobacterium tuberculosis]